MLIFRTDMSCWASNIAAFGGCLFVSLSIFGFSFYKSLVAPLYVVDQYHLRCQGPFEDLSQCVPIVTSLESPRKPSPPCWTPLFRCSSRSSLFRSICRLRDHLGFNLSLILWPENRHIGWFHRTMLTLKMSYSQHT